jgi:hypothetical protein
MKTKSIITLAACLFFYLFSEAQINIQQIRSSGFDDFISTQTLNPEQSNVASITQLGNRNSTELHQTKEGGLLSANQSHSFQLGELNSMDITQKGTGNILLSFQLGYITDYFGKGKGNAYGLENGNGNAFAYGLTGQGNIGMVSEGSGNTLTSFQDGHSNGLLTIQLGDNNSISATQKGNDIYAAILQQGTNNQVVDFKQENYSGNILFDSVIQIGDNLQLDVADAKNGRAYGNKYSQEGSNLSLTLNSDLLSPLGGMTVDQTGHDMHINVSQSYFSFPMK